MVSGLGDTSYAAVTQAGRYSFLYILFCFGITSGGAIFMSQFWGARDIRRMRQSSMGVSFVWIGAVAVVFIIGATMFSDFISRLFLPQGESASLANLYLKWVAPSYLFQGLEHGVRGLPEIGREDAHPADFLHRRHRAEHAFELPAHLRELRLPGAGRAGRGAGNQHLGGGHAVRLRWRWPTASACPRARNSRICWALTARFLQAALPRPPPPLSSTRGCGRLG